MAYISGDQFWLYVNMPQCEVFTFRRIESIFQFPLRKEILHTAKQTTKKKKSKAAQF